MAWSFAGQAAENAADDESTRIRLLEMSGVSIEEVPLPEAGSLAEDEAWTIGPGPARARIGATDVALAVQQKSLPAGATNVQATVDTSGLERLISSRLDQVEDTLRGVETRLIDTIPTLGGIAAEGEEGEDAELPDGVDAESSLDENSGDQIITSSGEVIQIDAENSRLMDVDSAPLLELYEAQALSLNPFLSSGVDLAELTDEITIGAHTIAALLLDKLSGMAASSFVSKAQASGMLSDDEASSVLAIVQLALPGEPDEALNDHFIDRDLLALSTLIIAWRKFQVVAM